MPVLVRKKGSRKRICGIVHRLLPCLCCKELIWTVMPTGNTCEQCQYSTKTYVPRIHAGNHHSAVMRSDKQYNG